MAITAEHFDLESRDGDDVREKLYYYDGNKKEENLTCGSEDSGGRTVDEKSRSRCYNKIY